MNKKIVLIVVAILVVVLVLYFSKGVLFPPGDQNIKLELVIQTSETAFSNNGSINITCSIFNNGEQDVKIRGNRDTVDIYDNNYLTFKIQDSEGNTIQREGGIHGVGLPLILSPGENLTIVADLNKYFPLENITDSISIQAIYSSGDFLGENGDILSFDGILESNIITLAP